LVFIFSSIRWWERSPIDSHHLHQNIVNDWKTLQKEHTIKNQALTSQRFWKMDPCPLPLTWRCEQDRMSQWDCWKKGLHVFFAKKTFFIWMNFGTICFLTCYNKCL
jgi:hypothetical protein